MKIFNEARSDFSSHEFLLLLDKKEAQVLNEALAFAAKANKRKRTWKALADKLYALLECY